MAVGCAVVILQGATFEEYLLRCGVVAGAQLARSHTPLVEASSGQMLVACEAAKLQADLDALIAMTDEAAEAECGAEHALACQEWEQRKTKRDATRLLYEAALARLDAWVPGPMFDSLKADAVRDIEHSLACDCDERRDRQPVRLSPGEWRVQQITEKQSAIEHLQRTAARYAWMHELRASLGLSADASAQI